MVELFSYPGNKISVIIHEPHIALQSLLGFGETQFLKKYKKFWILWICNDNLWDEMGLPRKSTCLAPKWNFIIVSFNPAWRMHWKTARSFRLRSVSLLAAIPISSTYWAHWSTLTTGSKYSRMLPSPLSMAVLSVSFLRISSSRFLGLTMHCTGVFPVWFSRNDSVPDPDTWGRFLLLAAFVIVHPFSVSFWGFSVILCV